MTRTGSWLGCRLGSSFGLGAMELGLWGENGSVDYGPGLVLSVGS